MEEPGSTGTIKLTTITGPVCASAEACFCDVAALANKEINRKTQTKNNRVFRPKRVIVLPN
jgi:hypothetical protein